MGERKEGGGRKKLQSISITENYSEAELVTHNFKTCTMLTVVIKFIPDNETSNHKEQNLMKLKRHVDSFTIIHGGCDTSSSEIDRANRTLKSTINI